jgi:hypothetical protein
VGGRVLKLWELLLKEGRLAWSASFENTPPTTQPTKPADEATHEPRPGVNYIDRREAPRRVLGASMPAIRTWSGKDDRSFSPLVAPATGGRACRDIGVRVRPVATAANGAVPQPG